MSVVAVSLTHEPLDPEAFRRGVESPELGGVVLFCGEVRSLTDGVATASLTYEAYEEMATQQMQAICEEAAERWRANVAVAHRLGTLQPGEIAVVAVAACAHRAEAFECCRFLIDRVKADAPIWKSG